MSKLIEISAWNDVAIPIVNISSVATISISYDQNLTEAEKDLCGKHVEACIDNEAYNENLPDGIEVTIVGSKMTFRKVICNNR